MSSSRVVNWNLPYPAHSVLLAPLAGMGDVALRQLCIEQGASLTFTEMISAKALKYGSDNSWAMLVHADDERCFGVQLFGHEADVMAEQALRVEDKLGDSLAVIDINMGCPVGKVVKRGEGAALLKTPALAAAIMGAVVEAVHVPVTVKMRRGYGDDDLVAPGYAHMAEECGVSGVTVHGRSAAQLYHGASDWDVIRQVKEAVSIPVIGNGDLFSSRSVEAMLEQTGADGAMVARGALGNPWIFSGVTPTFAERIDMAIRHVEMLSAHDPRHGLRRFRKHIPCYMRNMPHATAFRDVGMRVDTLEDLLGLFEAYRCELDAEGVLDATSASG